MLTKFSNPNQLPVTRTPPTMERAKLPQVATLVLQLRIKKILSVGHPSSSYIISPENLGSTDDTPIDYERVQRNPYKSWK